MDDEDAEPDEDTLNEMIARGPDEFELFSEMDRVRKAEEAARGDPPRLMEESELPDFYQKVYEEADHEERDDEIKGRGARKKNVINYGEGDIDEDLKFALFEGDDNDDEEDVRPIRGRGRRVKERTKEPSTAAPSRMPSPTDFDVPANSARGKKSARSGLKVVESPPDEDEESEQGDAQPGPAGPSSRKRVRQESMSTVAADEDVKHAVSCKAAAKIHAIATDHFLCACGSPNARRSLEQALPILRSRRSSDKPCLIYTTSSRAIRMLPFSRRRSPRM